MTAATWVTSTGNERLTATELADLAWESIRALNHLTLTGSGAPDDPAEMCTIVASLARGAAALPQLVSQLSRWLVEQQRRERLRLDAWTPTPDIGAAVGTVVGELIAAAHTACATGRALDAAHQVLAHLGAAGQV